MFQRLHHVAYRCKDAQRTVDFYTKVIGLEYSAGLMPPEGHTHWHYGDPSDSIHIFFKLGDGTFLAFFEIAGYEDAVFDDNTPLWVKHIAFEVPSMEFLIEAQKRLTAAGVDSRGPKDHGICQSVYFEDPDGHRLEMAVRTETVDTWKKLAEEAPKSLAEWNARKKKWGNRQIHKPKLAATAAE